MTLLLGALALLGAACAGDPPRGEAARVTVPGDLVAASEGGWAPVREGETLPDATELRTGAEEARIRLRRGEAWLAPRTRATVRRHRVTLRAGEVVLLSDGRLRGEWGDVEVSGDAAFRLTAGVTPRVAVYAGAVTVARPGETRAYPSLRQVPLRSPRLASDGEPLTYRARDAWDRLLLGPAIAFDAEIEWLTRGIDRRFGTSSRGHDFYASFTALPRSLVPTLRQHAPHTPAEGGFGPPSEVLVTAFVAEVVATRHDLELGRAADELVALRARGARWGLVAMEYGIAARDLAAAVDLGRRPGVALGAEAQPGRSGPGLPGD